MIDNRKVFLDVFRYINIFKNHLGNKIFLIALLSLFAAVSEGFGFLMVMPLFEVLDSSSNDPQGISKIIFNFLQSIGWNGSELILIIFIIATFAVKGILVFASMSYSAYLVSKLLKKLKSNLFDAYNSMGYSYYASRDTGHFNNIMNAQISKMLLTFRSLMRAGSEFVMTIAYISLAIIVSWEFGLTALLVGAIILILFRGLNIFVRELSLKTTYESGVLAKLLIQFLHAFKYLSSTNQGNLIKKQFISSVNRFVSYEYKRRTAEALTFSLREPILVISVMIIIMVQIIILEKDVAPILVAIALFYRGLNSIHSVQIYFQSVLDQVGAVEFVSKEFENQQIHVELDGDIKLESFQHDISFHNVNFKYDQNQENVLKNLSIKIPSKKTMAIIGSSGSGKSTLIDLITLLLTPTKGHLKIDGVDSTKLNKSSWRKRIGYVSQDLVVFDETIGNNISMWATGDQEEVIEAAKRASLHDFISSLPDGYETLVGDRGIRLSGGQKQRLFIAREIFRKPEILILDEATSALDSESERVIQDSVRFLMGQMTIIIVAHRLSTIKNVDYVCVLEKGELIEKGTYSQLKQNESSRLNELIKLQKI